MTEIHRLIGKGKSGWFADSCGKDYTSSSSSYNKGPEQLLKYAAEAEEGCPVYDASEADDDAFRHFVICGPSKDLRLAPGTIQKFTREDKNRALQMCGPGGLSGGFDTMVEMAALEDDEKLGSMDTVSLDIYLGLLRKIPGVRFGKVSKGRVMWEDGTITERPERPVGAPEFDERVVDGDSLNAVVNAGEIKTDCGAPFSGKQFDMDVVDGEGRPLAGRKAYGYSFLDGAGLSGVLTGRACWAYSGRGNAYEMSVGKGVYVWFADIKLV